MKALAPFLFGLSALASPALAQAPSPQAPLVFGAEVENVYIDAFVSHRGDPVAGLTAADFELRDNGVAQRLELATADAQPVQVILVFDMSNSLEGEKLRALRAAGQALLAALRPQDEATLFTFADEVRWLAKPSTDKAAVARALESLEAGGGSPVMDALFAAITLPKTQGRSLLVLFTDGIDNSSWLDWQQVRLVAERSNALIHVVSLRRLEVPPVPTQSLNFRLQSVPSEVAPMIEFEHTRALREIAETTGGRTFEAESLARLKTAFTDIAEAMSRRYVLRYAPEGVGRPGWHRIDLKLRGKRGEVRTRSGYWVAPVPSRTSAAR